MARKMFLLLALMVVATMSIGCAASRQQVAAMQAGGGVAVQQPASTTRQVVASVGCDGGGPKYFDSAQACSEAMASGACSYYTPSYTGGRGRNPVDGVKKVRVPLEKVACVQMHVVGGIHWVPQKEGEVFRFEKKADGILADVPYARDDCGNKVTGIVYPSPKWMPEPPPAVFPAPVPASAQVKTCPSGSSSGILADGEDPGKCYASQTWWEANKTTVTYVAVGVVAVGVAYCALSGRCGFWKHGGGKGGASSVPGGGGGPVGAGGVGGPVGGFGTR